MRSTAVGVTSIIFGKRILVGISLVESIFESPGLFIHVSLKAEKTYRPKLSNTKCILVQSIS